MTENHFKFEVTVDEVGSEHLNEGVPRIMASLENVDSVPTFPDPKDVLYVDLYGDSEKMLDEGFRKAGSEEYIISPVDTRAKFSHSFAECTGVVAVGRETNSGKNISFLSHQSPTYFLDDKKDEFMRDLRDRLEEIKERSEGGTIDVVMIGGRYARVKDYGQSDADRNIFMQQYIDSIKLVSGLIYESLGFYPVIIAGPKLVPSSDNVVFDTHNRRLYVQRVVGSIEPEFLESFSAKDIDSVRASWQPGQWGLHI